MATVVLMFLGLLLLLIPEAYFSSLSSILGFCLAVLFAYTVFKFLGDDKTLMAYIQSLGPVHISTIRSGCIAIGKSVGYTLNALLTPQNAAWWNPVAASESSQGDTLRVILEQYTLRVPH